MTRSRSLVLVALCLGSLSVLAGPAPKEKFHLYLLAGQSNMAGRGAVEEQDRTPHPRVFTLNDKDEWVPATEPLHFDKPKIAGVGPGFAFAKAMAEAQPDVTIGLIPCAVGGSPLSSWQPKATDEATKTTPYDTAIRRAKVAMNDGTIKGILWHQGESDSNEKSAPKYGNNLEQTLGRMRDDLGNSDLCMVLGELGPHTLAKNEWAKVVNNEIKTFGRRFDHCASVSADGLKDKGDQTHFDSASAREMGRRYAEAMLKLQALPEAPVVRLWPEGLPDGKPLEKPEETKVARTAKVSDPRMYVYLPSKAKANGTAVVICPGGGYNILAIDKEGHRIARWLNELGVTAFVLKSRLKDYKQPSPLLDAQQAIRTVRGRAAEWGIDANRVGIMGFSAGGHLAGATSNAKPVDLTHERYMAFNAIDCRPNFSILIYGVLPQPGDKWVKEMYTPIVITEATPPAFLVTTKDDPIPAQLSIDYGAACRKVNVPAEVHVYEKGGHGYGLGQSGGEVAKWPEACEAWMRGRGLIK
jgi:acetyl esterase/lipase